MSLAPLGTGSRVSTDDANISLGASITIICLCYVLVRLCDSNAQHHM